MPSYTVNVTLASVPPGNVLIPTGVTTTNLTVDPVTNTAITAAVAAANMSTYALKPRSGTKAVGQGELIFNAMDATYGAVGNGSTDDKTAIVAAMTAASNAATVGRPATVLLPWTPNGYLSSGILSIPSGVRLRGENRVLLKQTGSSQSIFIATVSNSVNCAIENLKIDSNGLATGETVLFNTSSSHASITNCEVLDSAGTTAGNIQIGSGCTDITVEGNTVHGAANGVRVVNATANIQRVFIRNNRIYDWTTRGINVSGGSGFSVLELFIEHNRVEFTSSAGLNPRQPISLDSSGGAVHQRVTIAFNQCIGSNVSFTATSSPGTGDQISIHETQYFKVIGNQSFYGGDQAMTIANDCKYGVVTGNLCMFADTGGISIGAGSPHESQYITVTGNVFMNNGQNRQGDRSTSRAGVYFNTASDHITVSGNVLADDQGSPTQLYGISTGSAVLTGVTIGSNEYSGVTPQNITGTLSGVKYDGPVKTGTAVLVAGTVTVSDTSTTANTIIRVSQKVKAGTAGALFISAKTAGTSFVINSTSASDVSTVYYEVLTY